MNTTTIWCKGEPLRTASCLPENKKKLNLRLGCSIEHGESNIKRNYRVGRDSNQDKCASLLQTTRLPSAIQNCHGKNISLFDYSIIRL